MICRRFELWPKVECKLNTLPCLSFPNIICFLFAVFFCRRHECSQIGCLNATTMETKCNETLSYQSFLQTNTLKICWNAGNRMLFAVQKKILNSCYFHCWLLLQVWPHDHTFNLWEFSLRKAFYLQRINVIFAAWITLSQFSSNSSKKWNETKLNTYSIPTHMLVPLKLKMWQNTRHICLSSLPYFVHSSTGSAVLYKYYAANSEMLIFRSVVTFWIGTYTAKQNTGTNISRHVKWILQVYCTNTAKYG